MPLKLRTPFASRGFPKTVPEPMVIVPFADVELAKPDVPSMAVAKNKMSLCAFLAGKRKQKVDAAEYAGRQGRVQDIGSG